MVADLDGFKQVNDRYGHLEGNKVLRALGSGLKSICREYDYVARMGGDEFVVLLPGARVADAANKVHQFHHMMAMMCRDLSPDRQLTASVGFATFPLDGSDAEQLLAEADRRMYKEKQARKERGDRADRNDRADRGLPVDDSQPAWNAGWTTTRLQ